MNGVSHSTADLAYGPAEGAPWRARWFHIIFGHDDAAGRAFDVILIVAILSSVLVTILDSVPTLHRDFAGMFLALEWVFTLAFSVEYLLRIAVVNRPGAYVRSFFGWVDLLSVLPAYLSLLFVGSQYLLVVRALRMLRIFRILKLSRYVDESNLLWSALVRSRHKILVFVCTILTLVLIFGALMYLVEGPEHGFTSIPTSMYWAIVTMTTVGFGDITPHTTLGQLLTSVIMLVGYSIIAVPTGIFAAELAASMRDAKVHMRCTACSVDEHEADARFCRRCGAALEATPV